MISWERFVGPVLYLVGSNALLCMYRMAYMGSKANHEKEDWINGQKTEDVVEFLDRLYTAKRKVEKRIVVLGGLQVYRPTMKLAQLVLHYGTFLRI